MNPEIERLLSDATDTQLEWVAARVQTRTDTAACRKIGIHIKTPLSKWQDKKPDLDQAVYLLKREAVAGAIFALESLALDAVNALAVSLNDKRYRVQAAREILSRVVPEKREVKTSLSIDSTFEEALERAYGSSIEVLDEPPAIPDNGKAVRVPARSG